jgi:hypothetical protein
MTTNVLKLPGDYKIKALNGLIEIEAGNDIDIISGGTVTIEAPVEVYVDTPLTTFTGDATVEENTILGLTTDNTIEANARFITDVVPKDSATYDLGLSTNTWNKLNSEEAEFYSPNNVGNPYGRPYDPGDIYDTEAHRREGSVYVTGGMGIEKDLNVGGWIYGRIDFANTTTFVYTTATNNDENYYLPFVRYQYGTPPVPSRIFVDETSPAVPSGLRYNPSTGKITTEQIDVVGTEDTSDPTTGALTVAGGVGIELSLQVGEDVTSSNLYAQTDNTGQIGTSSTQWSEAYIQNLFTRYIKSTTGTIQIAPKDPLTEIIGDIRVRGVNPIGTAPVVTNTLYVTVDGNDTNDGRAQDASRACRTIGGALRSPHYQPGTQILVSAGRYLEDNPLRLKPYTSIRGSDIRTTFIEPINKTQDLFHLDSGCYLNYMTFLNGRSGLLEGPYEQGFNRGAYATAFPPLSGADRIDLFHSPYVQNCTNQSGPWFRDGTMFVPNQSIQVPAIVGTGTWAFNTTSIVVNVVSEPINGFINAGQPGSGTTDYTGHLESTVNLQGTIPTVSSLPTSPTPILLDGYITSDTGDLWVYTEATTITQGMYVNSGQQNPGFFNARTLMLANKQFIQEQVVEFVEQTFNSGSFSYDAVKCERDIGLIVDSIAIDLLQNSESESIFAGLQYWRQSGYVDSIGDQITTTTDAINYVKSQAILAVSSPFDATVGSKFDIIIDILNTPLSTISSGAFAETITNLIEANPNGIASTDPATVAAYDALLAAKSTIATNTINYISIAHPLFTSYSVDKCTRDVGYMIDSVAFDLLHGGSKQSIKSGVYYFGYSAAQTEVPNELPQTVQAYNFIKSLVSNVVLATPIVNPYQVGVTQTTGLNSATIYEVNALEDSIDLITKIIRNGPSVVDARIPINLNQSGNTNVLNAYNLLVNNRAFIQAETIAYINSSTFSTFSSYSKEKCYRDVGILVENIAYDAAFGGNQKAIESGLAYYDGVISRIAGQETQTVSAIDYLNQLTQDVITNTSAPDLLSGSGVPQVINWVLTNGDVASESINNLVNIITDIINKGPSAAPTMYSSTGPDAAFVSAEVLLQANREFIQQNTINYINNIIYAGGLPYSEIKCRRDTGLIIDSIATDLMHYTPEFSQSTFAGLQYWSQDNYVGDIEDQLNPTVAAMIYLKETAAKIMKNITPADDLIDRYHTGSPTQDTSLEAATDAEVFTVNSLFDLIIEIVNGRKTGWTDRIISNGLASHLPSIQNAYNILQENKEYLGYEITAYVDATNFGFTYDLGKCRRDVGYMIDAVCFDMVHGGNRQSIQNGLYYYGFSTSLSNIHGNQNVATIAAFNYLSSISGQVIQNITVTPNQSNAVQIFGETVGTSSEATTLANAISTITNIIQNSPTVASQPTQVYFTASNTTSTIAAYSLLNSNRTFLVEQTIAFIDQTYNPGAFNYNEAKCYRDVGLIVDAVSQDILLGGNQKSIEAGLAYWSAGYNYVTGQETTTTMAINYASTISLQIIANQPVVVQSGTTVSQIINPFFDYGWEYGPQEAVARNFNIITDIIERGPIYAPPVYAGGGLFSLTGLNGSDVKISPQVTSVVPISAGTYRIGLSTSTIGFGTNSTLYFGDTLIFPIRDNQVEEQSLKYTGSTSTWQQRKIDPIGSMGGSLVDGAVISDRSPIQSFVYDAFTQVNQGGRGIHITNDGYAQLVSVFTIFCSVGVQTDNGGIASIVNSNANFGNICLLSKGYGRRKFSGTIYNPAFKSYPDDPVFNEFFPEGYWPNGGRVRAFIPDLDDRPHISLVMEIVPPDGHENEQNFPGFLNATPNKAALTTGTITITDIDTEGIAVGNYLYVRDQNGFEGTGTIFKLYADTGTIVTDVGYRSVTLNKALTNGGSDPEFTDNDNYFNLYFCGNAYYTVLSSEVGDNPLPVGTHVLSANPYTGITIDQRPAHIASLHHLSTITNKVISNIAVTPLSIGTTANQIINPLILGGNQAIDFINLRFNELINIVDALNLAQAEAVIPSSLRTTSGPAVEGASAAVRLITDNIEFIADEVTNYAVEWINASPTPYTMTDSQQAKCKRDTKIILQRLIYDIQSGGRYNTVMSGLSYWQRNGTHHIIQLGENVRRTELFPDGSTINFFQRSYMSASGYVFEYVGAGIDYGALPQRGVADPKQGQEVVMLDSGKVFFTSTDQNGDFRIGPGLVISQATGVLSGRTFTKSLFANMTPFILAIESGGG